jgi:hypothetical protein
MELGWFARKAPSEENVTPIARPHRAYVRPGIDRQPPERPTSKVDDPEMTLARGGVAAHDNQTCAVLGQLGHAIGSGRTDRADGPPFAVEPGELNRSCRTAAEREGPVLGHRKVGQFVAAGGRHVGGDREGLAVQAKHPRVEGLRQECRPLDEEEVTWVRIESRRFSLEEDAAFGRVQGSEVYCAPFARRSMRQIEEVSLVWQKARVVRHFPLSRRYHNNRRAAGGREAIHGSVGAVRIKDGSRSTPIPESNVLLGAEKGDRRPARDGELIDIPPGAEGEESAVP